MNLGDWRSRIDDLDNQILNLLNQRAEAALRTGDLHRRQDAPSSVPEREAALPLEPVARPGINLTAIESRPGLRRPWASLIRSNPAGPRHAAPVAAGRAEVGERARLLWVLGSYPAA